MKLYELIEILEKAFPPELAYEWDNVGLLVGDKNRDIKKMLAVLDVTEKAVEKAIELGVDLILSHHPVLFSPIKRITTETISGRVIIKAIENGINIYAAHTNCDIADGGINAYLAELFELEDAEPLEETGLGRIGNLKEEMNFADFAGLVKEKLNTPFVRVCGESCTTVKRVAIGSGACSDLVCVAKEKGADVMITGDTKYHEMLDSTEEGICVIDAGHYPTEAVVVDIFEKVLSDSGVKVEKYLSKDVFWCI